MHEYNHERGHQSLGDRPPIERFALAEADPLEEPLELAADPVADDAPVPAPQITRVVSSSGWISLVATRYHAGRWLAGQTVQVAVRDGLVELSHGGVIIATHARRHSIDKEPAVFRASGPRRRPSPDAPEVTRKVDSSGYVSFAGWTYRAGNAYRRRQVQVSVVDDTVHISFEGRLVRSHPIRHDRSKEHGAFANPGGRPRRINAA